LRSPSDTERFLAKRLPVVPPFLLSSISAPQNSNRSCQNQAEAENVAVQAAANFKVCPFCKERIREEAVKCRFCGEWLEPQAVQRSTPQTENRSLDTDRRKNTESPDDAAPSPNSMSEPVDVADHEKPMTLQPPKPASKLTVASQDKYWDGYVYAMFCAYITYCCITQLLGTLTRPPTPGDAYAQGQFWGGIVLWSLATAGFSYATYQLVTRKARLGLIYSVVALHGINVLARGIRPGELVLWLVLSMVVISKFRQRQLLASDGTSEEAGYEPLHKATELETKGKVEEALAAYRRVAEKFAGTTVGRDAEKSIEILRGKIG
jgi:hypothetical protein